jgi:hypothetical protein
MSWPVTDFTPKQGFSDLRVTRIGAIEVSYLWPGTTDARAGVSSEGVYDHGGPEGMATLRNVVSFPPDTASKRHRG